MPIATFDTLADVLEHLGGIPPERVRMSPAPGRATERDLLRVLDRENRPCELVDGVLVEKARGFYESRVASVLGYFLESYLEKHDLGIVLGADGTLRLMPGLVRIPDLSFISWKRLPGRELPPEPIPDLVPDLAVEVLSKGNTAAEMKQKLHEYFEAGVQIVWFIEAQTRSAKSFTSPTDSQTLAEGRSLTGGSLLPGFRLPLKRLFDRAGKRKKP